MDATMTVAELVRDACKTAAELVRHGNKITVTSGNKVLFRIVPEEQDEPVSPARLKAFTKDLEALAQTPVDNNPVLKLRQRRP